jgi:superoxide reductase
MTERNQVYVCKNCGNIVEVNHAAGGTLTCCNKPMELQNENTTDASKEKHVPVIEKMADGTKVKVGSVAHPMQAEHYIEWVEVFSGNAIQRKYLKPGETPEAAFAGNSNTARAYCNLHGLWKSQA